MKGFLWIAACGAVAMTGAAMREAPNIIDDISGIQREIGIQIDSERDGDSETIRITRGDGTGSEHDAAKAAIEAELNGESAEDVAAAEEAIVDATDALAEANNRIAEIQADEDLSDEDRAAALAEAREAREAAVSDLRDTVNPVSDEPGDDIAAGVEQAVNGILTAVEQSDTTISQDGRELSGEERAEAIADARRELSEAIEEARDEIESEMAQN